VTTTRYRVLDVRYGPHTKRGAAPDAPTSLRVDYWVGGREWKSEWVCFEHDGYAGQKAAGWWRRRSPDPVPDTVERAIEIIDGGGLATTLSITVRSVAGERFDKIIDCELGPIPEALSMTEYSEVNSQEVPF
jgi:DNA repair protein RadD